MVPLGVTSFDIISSSILLSLFDSLSSKSVIFLIILFCLSSRAFLPILVIFTIVVYN